MDKPKLDNLDKDLIRLLKVDGRLPTAHIAERLEVTTPTVRSRMKALIARGVMRVAGLVNLSAASDLTTALIGINIESLGQLNNQLEQLTAMKQVHWAAVVTGRFDVIAEVVVNGGMEDLYRFTSVDLPAIGRVTHCETFVVMRSSRKWMFSPDGLEGW
ncbi:transcriptional regulator [Desulfosarcina alkanivorans]|uniref:Transcriptional regulator n=1 Tax=Desulfosarcina alkanivorans TaxID=571177 RepID=A0A5K7YN63_9BACT|nr:Lrp/AsnC family transcriptional regulator [Desulfosarcina alkanivorans]BBO68341.1 transcriptional regulator [Desulfosarcina alkanivorans]